MPDQAANPSADPSANPYADPRIYFAAERTFLAWIRTGLALIGVGFALARFGLFLRQIPAATRPLHGSLTSGSLAGRSPTGFSVDTGVVLLALGVAINVLAILHHIGTIRALRTTAWIPGQVSKSAVALSALLAVVGLGAAVYLLLLG